MFDSPKRLHEYRYGYQRNRETSDSPVRKAVRVSMTPSSSRFAWDQRKAKDFTPMLRRYDI